MAVQRVQIYTGDRSQSMFVMLAEAIANGKPFAGKQCDVATADQNVTDVACNNVGRYVTIGSKGKTPRELSLCEVKVFGKKVCTNVYAIKVWCPLLLRYDQPQRRRT